MSIAKVSTVKSFNMPSEIILNLREINSGVQVGGLRQIEAILQGKEDSHGFVGDGWGTHIEGACAEIAVAKCLNLYWEPRVNTYKFKADIGENIEVRRRSLHDYDALIRSSDQDNHFFIHVTGKIPKFLVHGWILAADAKKHNEWIKNHGNRPSAWFVPPSYLKSLEEFPGLNERKIYGKTI